MFRHTPRIWFEVDAFLYINAGYLAIDGHPFFLFSAELTADLSEHLV